MAKLKEHTTPIIPELRFKEFKDNWTEVRLEAIAKFKKGKGVSKSDISEIGKTECIRYGQLYTEYNEIIKNIVSKTDIPKTELELSEANDVIIPASGETNIDIATASCVLKSGIALGGDLNIIRTPVNGIFLSFYLNSKKKHDIARLAQGVSVVHLYNSHLQTLKLNLPKGPEQIKIASFFTAVNEKVNQLISKKELLTQYKKGAMQQLFKQEIRFKDENGKTYPKWEEKKLNGVSERVSVGLATSVTAYYIEKSNESIPIIRNLNIKNGFFDDSDMLYLEPSFSARHQNKRVKKGDIITVHTGSNVGLTCVVPEEYNMAQTFTTLVVTPKKNILFANYLNQLLASDYGNYQALRLVVGGGKGNLNTNDFKLYPVPLPIYEEQQKIANYLSAIDTKIEKINSTIEETQTFKRGMLQKLFI